MLWAFLRVWVTLFVLLLGAAVVLAGVIYMLSGPDMVCAQYSDERVIEDIDVGSRVVPTVVTRTYCSEWKAP